MRNISTDKKTKIQRKVYSDRHMRFMLRALEIMSISHHSSSRVFFSIFKPYPIWYPTMVSWSVPREVTVQNNSTEYSMKQGVAGGGTQSQTDLTGRPKNNNYGVKRAYWLLLLLLIIVRTESSAVTCRITVVPTTSASSEVPPPSIASNKRGTASIQWWHRSPVALLHHSIQYVPPRYGAVRWTVTTRQLQLPPLSLKIEVHSYVQDLL